MSSARSAQAAHLCSELDALAHMDGRIKRLQYERAVADEDLRRAQRRASDLAAQEAQLKIQQAALSQSVSIARAAYVREFLDTCPDDLLRCIFETAVNAPDKNWQSFGFGHYNSTRAHAPFFLAAVCSRWRRVALSCPTLWTYLGLPDPHGLDMKQQLRRISLLLARSFPCPIEILVPSDWDSYELLQESDPFEEYFARLVMHSSRWKKVELWMPMDISIRHLDVLRGSLPLLSEFSLTVTTPEQPALDDRPRDGYLPSAPRLQKLDLAFWGASLSQVFHPGFPELKFLRCWSTCPVTTSAQLLKLSQRTIEQLDIGGDAAVAAFPLAMPRLHTLALQSVPSFGDRPLPGTMLLPNLTALALKETAIVLDLVPFLDHIAPQVSRLQLCGDIKSGMLDTLKHLHNITSLVFERTWTNTHCDVQDQFFLHLADSSPCIWPKLQSLELATGTTSQGHGDGLLHLVIKRSIQQSTSNTQEAPGASALKEVILAHGNAPAWLVAEVSRVLRSDDSEK